MIGFVSPDLRPILRLCVSNGDVSQDIECWVDTGFDGGLLLPESLVATLKLQEGATVTATLADGSTVEVQSYRVWVLWNNQKLRVQAVAADAHPLAGLHLLHGHEIRITLTSGGAVSIEAID